jgi:hypothetical protein
MSARQACADCRRPGRYLRGRGLCDVCYRHHEAQGDLANWPTSAQVRVADWAFLRLVAELSVEDAVERIGTAYRTGLLLDRHLRADLDAAIASLI